MAKHAAFIMGMTGLLVLAMLYPFLPGQYDSLAGPISVIVQVFGVVGMPLALVGLLWLVMPRFRFAFGAASLALGVLVSLVVGLFAALSAGKAFGILVLAVCSYTLVQMAPRLKRLKSRDDDRFNPAPWYLVCLPTAALVSQLVLAEPMTQGSRDRAITHAQALIGDIEEFHARNGRYPLSLQAVWPDYQPGGVGVEQYRYEAYGDAYNLAFEQPRFLLDAFGTREFVVYNPGNGHSMVSHAAWRLSNPDWQGWYASGETGSPNWKYFLFD